MTLNIVFNVGELADLYALRTLYKYLSKKDKTHNFEFSFSGNVENQRGRQIIGESNFQYKKFLKPDIVVSTYSDMGGRTFGDKRFEIDISILKNCAKPVTIEKKEEILKKYNLKKDKPLLVIGFSNTTSNLERVISGLYNSTNIVLVGNLTYNECGLDKKIKDKLIYETRHGVLNDYYAVADFAINANNLEVHNRQLHNFIEETEGGPLFLVPPTKTMQYGYDTLVNMGVIIECCDDKDIVKKIKKYVDKDFSKIKYERQIHISKTRKTYLPWLRSKMIESMENKLDYKTQNPGLAVAVQHNLVRVTHPKTVWDITINNNVYL